eukprot:7437806-Pyramimonas_sp.AAC.1
MRDSTVSHSERLVNSREAIRPAVWKGKLLHYYVLAADFLPIVGSGRQATVPFPLPPYVRCADSSSDKIVIIT